MQLSVNILQLYSGVTLLVYIQVFLQFDIFCQIMAESCSIDIQWVVTTVCQYWQDSGKI